MMQKHLFLYAWICAALVLGILICAGLILYMLLTQQPQTAFISGAEFVKGALHHAAI